MKETELFVNALSKDWTLFLDRDGVINKRLPDEYVKNPLEFEFIEGVTSAIRLLSNIFGRIILVTNQQGIGKGVMTEEDLFLVHNFMLEQILKEGGRIDAIYFCPDLASKQSNCRKPGSSMAIQSKNDFPEIDFSRSVMVGDTQPDIEFGKRLNMKTIYVGELPNSTGSDFTFSSLYHFSLFLIDGINNPEKGVKC